MSLTLEALSSGYRDSGGISTVSFGFLILYCLKGYMLGNSYRTTVSTQLLCLQHCTGALSEETSDSEGRKAFSTVSSILKLFTRTHPPLSKTLASLTRAKFRSSVFRGQRELKSYFPKHVTLPQMGEPSVRKRGRN